VRWPWDCTKAARIEPRCVDAYYWRAVVHHQQKNYRLAIADYGRAISLSPQNADLYANRARAHYCLRAYDDAWTDVHKAESLGLTIDAELLAELRKGSGKNE
jgi:tetratricopeptide (TPR) repeat protein